MGFCARICRSSNFLSCTTETLLVKCLKHSICAYGCTTSTPTVLLILLPSVPSPPFKLRIHLPGRQDSVRGHDVDLTTVIIRPAVRCFRARVLGRWLRLCGTGSKLIGTLVARGGKLLVGFDDRRDFGMDNVEYFYEEGAESRDAGGDYYYVYFETVQGSDVNY